MPQTRFSSSISRICTCLALELRDVPDLSLALEGILAGRLAHHLAVDQQLRRRLARRVAAGDEETDVWLRQLEHPARSACLSPRRHRAPSRPAIPGHNRSVPPSARPSSRRVGARPKAAPSTFQSPKPSPSKACSTLVAASDGRWQTSIRWHRASAFSLPRKASGERPDWQPPIRRGRAGCDMKRRDVRHPPYLSAMAVCEQLENNGKNPAPASRRPKLDFPSSSTRSKVPIRDNPSPRALVHLVRPPRIPTKPPTRFPTMTCKVTKPFHTISAQVIHKCPPELRLPAKPFQTAGSSGTGIADPL